MFTNIISEINQLEADHKENLKEKTKQLKSLVDSIQGCVLSANDIRIKSVSFKGYLYNFELVFNKDGQADIKFNIALLFNDRSDKTYHCVKYYTYYLNNYYLQPVMICDLSLSLDRQVNIPLDTLLNGLESEAKFLTEQSIKKMQSAVLCYFDRPVRFKFNGDLKVYTIKVKGILYDITVNPINGYYRVGIDNITRQDGTSLSKKERSEVIYLTIDSEKLVWKDI